MFNPLFIVAAQNFQRALKSKEDTPKEQEEKNSKNLEKSIDKEEE